MDRQEIIALLKQDMRGEHQAIIQYLAHAYAMGEGEIACEIEAIAREEMRHFDWLADAIVELGGDPELDREPPDLSPGTPEQNMRKNVDLEQAGIDQYRAHIAAIDDPDIRRLLSRILHDELVHQEQFEDLAKEAAKEAQGEKGESPSEGATESLNRILNMGISHEYAVILQYLYHSFVAEDKELAEELQTAAINEMQHMGWLAEALAGRGGKPVYEHDEIFVSRDHARNLQADIDVERRVTQMYSRQIPELPSEALQKLLGRIRDHEIYHDAVFSHLLDELSEQQSESEGKGADKEIPSVGSLKE